MDGELQKHVVALSGDIGAGTQIVLEMLQRLGYRAIDADEVAQRLTRRGGPAYEDILLRYGIEFLGSEAELDRAKLSQAMETRPQVGETVRAIVYASVKEVLSAAVDGMQQPLLFIKANNPSAYGLRDLCDLAWSVTATEDLQIQSLVRDHGWSLPLARQFARSQHTHSVYYAEPPDVVLCNTGERGALWSQLLRALRQLEHPELTKVPACEEAVEPGQPQPAAAAPPPVQEKLAKPTPAAENAEQATEVGERLLGRELKLIGRQVLNAVVILLALAVMTSWGLMMAENGRQHLPVSAVQSVWQALVKTAQYFAAHPPTYLSARQQVPWLQLVSTTLGHSAALLVLSLGVALLIGLPLGMAAATVRNRILAAIVMVLSVLGSSVPSFILAMLLWVLNGNLHRWFNIRVLPTTGFGWDAHLVMPILVIAMRPLAQIAQVAYVSLGEVLRQDYVRTAYSKGLTWRAVRDRHVLRNTLIPILSTVGTSLRFSLSSLPIVEVFFHWPGVGSMLLDAINQGNAPLVLDLILSLGLFFLLVNLLIEFSFPLVDPRLRKEQLEATRSESQSPLDALKELKSVLAEWIEEIRRPFRPRQRPTPEAAARRELARATEGLTRSKRNLWLLRNLLRNPTFILSSIALIMLIVLAIFGSNMTSASPYQVHGVMRVDGEYAAPPFKPSSVFPWGTDHIGRDVQALVLAGAQKTLSLAFFGMLARLLIGGLLGMLAGWWSGSRFDRLIQGATGVWAAFPATLFAMIVIQGLGIQQGMWVFVVGICMVGWGEVEQFVRSQVMSLKPSSFVESARATGAREDQILSRHILPNLANPMLVLAALEMGGVLMLLAELGFLNVFMGGGFRAMIGESGSMQPIIASYSDVPEWAALIANVRAQWRSYPWMALYPGAAVLISILTFNLFGEGLRRFLEDSAIGLSRLFNRYTFAAAAAIAVVVALVLQSSGPMSVYRTEAMKFDEQRVLEDIRILSSPRLQGRETGSSGATLAALYIAQRMAQLGIFPAGQHNTYLQRQLAPRMHLLETPTLKIQGDSGTGADLLYKQDFIEMARLSNSRGEAQAPIMGVAYGPPLDEKSGPVDLRTSAAMDHVIILRAADLGRVRWSQVKGALVVADDDSQLAHRNVYPSSPLRGEDARPCLLVSAAVADELLKSAGTSLAELDAKRASLAPGEVFTTREGPVVHMAVPAPDTQETSDEAYINVIGVIPGQGHFMGTEDQVIVVSAYYDGVGTDPTGTVYPGANDNASGVAMMLELARLLKNSAYQPDKTVLFVAWAGGERQEGLSVVNILNARAGASDMRVETVLELSGVGDGTGNSISIGNDSSYRLVQLFQKAAGRYGIGTTTRGRGPHYDLPAKTIFGGRDAMTLSLSWDGSDALAHTTQDTADRMDPVKVRSIGRPAYLTLLVLARETEY